MKKRCQKYLIRQITNVRNNSLTKKQRTQKNSIKKTYVCLILSLHFFLGMSNLLPSKVNQSLKRAFPDMPALEPLKSSLQDSSFTIPLKTPMSSNKYYMFKGIFVNPNAFTRLLNQNAADTYDFLNLGLKKNKPEHNFVCVPDTNCDFKFFEILKDGSLDTKSDIIKVQTLEEIPIEMFEYNSWTTSLRLRYVYTKENDRLFLLNAKTATTCDVILSNGFIVSCKHALVRAMTQGKIHIVVPPFLITLCGNKPCAMRIFESSLHAKCVLFTSYPIDIDEKYFSVPSGFMDDGEISVQNKSLCTAILEQHYIPHLAHKSPALIELYPKDRLNNVKLNGIIETAIRVFWSSLLPEQREKIKRLKISHVYNSNFLIRLRAERNILSTQVGSNLHLLKPMIGFHAIKKSDFLQTIVETGFVSSDYIAERAALCLTDEYIESPLGTTRDCKNCIVLTLCIPGRRGTHLQMARNQESIVENSAHGLKYWIKDSLMLPYLVFQVD